MDADIGVAAGSRVFGKHYRMPHAGRQWEKS
jgi:hypothetical protein